MFITLKCPNGQGVNEMEEIASQGAGPRRDRNRLRLGRRPACLSCQTKKLRCTGPVGQCDGCRMRSISCVLSPTPARQHARQMPTYREARSSSLEETPSLPDVRPGTVSTSAGSENGNTQTGHLFDFDFDLDMGNVMMDLEDLSRNNPDLTANDIVGAMDPRHEGLNNPIALQYAFGSDKFLPSLTLDNLPLPRSSSQTQITPDPQLAVNAESLASINMSDDTVSSGLAGNNNITKPRQGSNVATDVANSTNPNKCDCMNNTLRVVQQLDDDEFRITTLTLGQVLQLQKWIISQCYKPIDCVNCKYRSTVHTVLVIVCDRLAEMFECIHKRIYRANQRMTGFGDSGDSNDPSDASDLSTNADSDATMDSGGQLYCVSSGGPAGKARCDPGLFSSQIHVLYSNEEQVHMIQVLLKLQIRNFKTLLVQIQQASKLTGSLARQSKIDSMSTRLVRAAGNIDRALWEAIQYFSNGESFQ